MSVAITIWPRPAQICIYVRFCWHKEYINIGSSRSRLLEENFPFFHFYNGKGDMYKSVCGFQGDLVVHVKRKNVFRLGTALYLIFSRIHIFFDWCYTFDQICSNDTWVRFDKLINRVVYTNVHV